LSADAFFGLHGKVYYDVNDKWRGSGTLTWYFDKIYDWSLDLDVHNKVLDFGYGQNFVPFGGLSIFRKISGENINNSSANIGFNAGVSINYKYGGRAFYLEPKYLFKDGCSLIVSAGMFL